MNVTLAQTMISLGIVQEGDPVLTRRAQPFELPAEEDVARQLLISLSGTLDRLADAYLFSKGMGIAAPQVGISRAAAVIRTVDGQEVGLLNPQITRMSARLDIQNEGCLSFFDVRGAVSRPLAIVVEFREPDGAPVSLTLARAAARLACHEIDHLEGILYRERMASGTALVPAEAGEGTGPWQYG